MSLKQYESEVCVDGFWCCEPVLRVEEVKAALTVNVDRERQLFEETNRVPNGVFWAEDHYNFSQGTDQTTWMLFANRWQGWLECAQNRAKLVGDL